MKIYDLKVSKMKNPLGIRIEDIFFSCKTDKSTDLEFSLFSEEMTEVHSEKISRNNLAAFRVGYSWSSGTKYFWLLRSDEAESEMQHFETPAVLDAPVIRAAGNISCPVFSKTFHLPAGFRDELKSARLYISGLGLYRAFINGRRVGNDYLSPFYNDYDAYVRYQTYDIAGLLEETNTVEVFTGDGWFKGRFGIDGHGADTWGDSYYLSALLRIHDINGSVFETATDETWKTAESVIKQTSIYDGEFRDDSAPCSDNGVSISADRKFNLIPDFTHPVRKMRELKPTLYTSPEGELILDFGQNMVGFCGFYSRLKKGEEILLQYGEVLQNGCFYRDNLRSAKAEYRYISDGTQKQVEPWFTFYGFRYVKVTGPATVNPDDFTGVVLYSELDQTIEFDSGSPKLNRLVENTLWSQRGNFLDVPTDCPQRDERLGWTADTQVFVNTGCYNMDCYNFYRKYMRDLRYEQETYYNGDIPMYAPSLKKSAGDGGAVWADAGVIIPWNVYYAYGDKVLLSENYPMMKDYVQTLIVRDAADGGTHIIRSGFTFGDWLAQDGISEQSMIGGTEDVFIKTAYYFHAVSLISKAAEVLSEKEDYCEYSLLAEKIKTSLINEYFTPSGRFALDTQTSFILVLKFGLYPDRERVLKAFRERLRKDLFKMKSGFTGTPMMLPVLFENGMDEEAYRILFNEEIPGWMYAVNLGATTIWERWNSLLPDGTISGIHMNSLNHYAYGSVCEAVYAHIAGLQPAEPGWGSVIIAPKPNHRLKSASIRFNSPKGVYSVEWAITSDGDIQASVEIPSGCFGELILPAHPEEKKIQAAEGRHQFKYRPEIDYLHPYNTNSLILDILKNTDAEAVFREELPRAFAIVTGENRDFLPNPLFSLAFIEMFGAGFEDIERTGRRLEQISV